MNHILLGLAILFGVAAEAASVPGAVGYVQGGQAVDGTSTPSAVYPVSDLSKRRTLIAADDATTSGNYYAFYRMGGTASGQYQVGSGKTLHCMSLEMTANQNSAWVFGYGTAALASNDTATPPTGEFVYAPAASSARGLYLIFGSTIRRYWPIYMSFPSLSYPFVRSNTGSTDVSMTLDCIEL